jgi:hypothetical protein
LLEKSHLRLHVLKSERSETLVFTLVSVNL